MAALNDIQRACNSHCLLFTSNARHTSLNVIVAAARLLTVNAIAA